MAGFKNSSLNSFLKQSYYDKIILLLESGSDLMLSSGKKIQNHEEKITAHLHYYYLDNKDFRDSILGDSFPFKFIIESPEKFNYQQNTYHGRTDIKVVSNNWFSGVNLKDYFTIECKRIDGYSELNKKYIEEGVARFIIPSIKYESYHNKNIMLAYVVKQIDVLKNIRKIDDIHKSKLISYISKDITYLPDNSSENCYICESEYILEDRKLLLNHIFYDFSSIIT